VAADGGREDRPVRAGAEQRRAAVRRPEDRQSDPRTILTLDGPDETLVEVRHKDHDDTVSPGIVPLGWLRNFGADNWVEVDEAGRRGRRVDPATGQEG
jgi:hypothetical protein